MATNLTWCPLSGHGRRCVMPELLPHASLHEREANLRDLARINRWFGGYRVARNLMREVARPGENLTVLDAGAGAGDVGRAIRCAFPRATVVSLDRHHLHLRRAQTPRLVADVFQLPFPPRSFDVVFCSLVLHEYPDSDAATLLRRLFDSARRALVVVDLYRHPVAYHFLPATDWLFNWHRLTLHDGPISVAAAFRPRELRALAHGAGLEHVRVRLHWPWFRISLLARRERDG